MRPRGVLPSEQDALRQGYPRVVLHRRGRPCRKGREGLEDHRCGGHRHVRLPLRSGDRLRAHRRKGSRIPPDDAQPAQRMHDHPHRRRGRRDRGRRPNRPGGEVVLLPHLRASQEGRRGEGRHQRAQQHLLRRGRGEERPYQRSRPVHRPARRHRGARGERLAGINPQAQCQRREDGNARRAPQGARPQHQASSPRTNPGTGRGHPPRPLHSPIPLSRIPMSSR